MPVAFAAPAIAGVLAGYGAGVMGWTIMGSALAAAVVTGAVAGAVVGGLQAAITGGSIGEGILFGAVGGAVGGAIGGIGYSSLNAPAGAVTTTTEGGVTTLSGSSKTAPGVIGPGGKEAVGLSLGEGATTALVTGGMGAMQGLMSPDPDMPYGQTKEGFEAELASKKELTAMQLEASKSGSDALAAAKIAAEQRQREAELNANLTREQMQQSGSEFHKSLAQRKAELERPIEEQNLARQRRIETAMGLTLARKNKEAANPTLFEEELTA